MGTVLLCPLCNAQLCYVEGRDWWECRNSCGVWTDYEDSPQQLEQKEKEAKEQAELREKLRWSVGGAYTEVLPLSNVRDRKKSSNKSGRKRKKPSKKYVQPWHVE